MPQAICEDFLGFSVPKGFGLTEKSLDLDEKTFLYQAEEFYSQSARTSRGARSEFVWLLGEFRLAIRNIMGTSYRC